MSDPTCEICGQPATRILCDAREVPPLPGTPWRRWEPAGRHAYCDLHDREVIMEALPGSRPLPDLKYLQRLAEVYRSLGLTRGNF